jgi:hypothetical protein
VVVPTFRADSNVETTCIEAELILYKVKKWEYASAQSAMSVIAIDLVIGTLAK